MKQFTYTITDPLGIQLMMLMGLAIKKDQEVTITVEGPAEEEAAAALKAFFEENL